MISQIHGRASKSSNKWMPKAETSQPIETQPPLSKHPSIREPEDAKPTTPGRHNANAWARGVVRKRVAGHCTEEETHDVVEVAEEKYPEALRSASNGLTVKRQ